MSVHRLFVKIFLWFWLAIILVGSASVLVSAWIGAYFEPADANIQMIARATQGMPASLAAIAFEEQGREGLDRFLQIWRTESRSQAFLFDDAGRELSGHEVPGEIHDLAVRAAREGGTQTLREPGRTPVAAVPVPGRKNHNYIYVAELPPPPAFMPQNEGRRHAGPPPPSIIGFIMHEPYRLTMIIAAIVITGGAVCYWLSRHVTRPLEHLRAATSRLAEGDLAVRVGGGIGSRRDELGDLGRAFDRMAGQIESLVGTQHRLLRDISHELRSPLARLSLALGIARQQSSGQVSEWLDRIEHESERLNELIEQLLTVTRLENPGVCADQEPLDLGEMLLRVVEDARLEAEARGVSIAPSGIESFAIDGNRELLHRALENVVRNAVSYTAAGTRVEVSLASEKTGHAIVQVRDHGPGVPQEALADLFRPFYRVADGRERGSGGVGLGLAITERAILAHGGSVMAENASGGGLRITIHLPLAGPSTR